MLALLCSSALTLSLQIKEGFQSSCPVAGYYTQASEAAKKGLVAIQNLLHWDRPLSVGSTTGNAALQSKQAAHAKRFKLPSMYTSAMVGPQQPSWSVPVLDGKTERCCNSLVGEDAPLDSAPLLLHSPRQKLFLVWQQWQQNL